MRMTSNPSTPNDKRSSTSRFDHPASGDGRLTSTIDPNSTIRPRNRRLISTSTELTNEGVGEGSSAATRAVSPIPSRHPSRLAHISSAKGVADSRPAGGVVFSDQGSQSPKFGFGKGLWDGSWADSWSALQGLASSVLGSDVDDNNASTDSIRTARDALRRKAKGGNVNKKPQAAWGPTGQLFNKVEDSIGAGSLAARESDLKARKTASILESHDGVNGGLDINGRHKRRTSQDDLRSSGPQDDDADALVYVHHVQPSDTLAGVVLKYNCPPGVFRKANRLWPNDVIQVRRVVLLPVDACAIKGRPCDPPAENQQIDLLATTPNVEEPSLGSGDRNGSPRRNRSSAVLDYEESQNLPFPGSVALEEEEHPWSHVCWVLLDSSPSARPTEIARLPRKTLGYFPPRRRKSQVTSSSLSTPRGSLDFTHRPRISSDVTSSPIGSPSRRLSNLNPESLRTDSYFPSQSPLSLPKHERDNAPKTIGQLRWMQGPGGVGTFDKNVRRPGPAQDGLNTWAAKHMPSLTIGNLPSSSASDAETVSFGFRDELAAIEEGSFRSFPASGNVTPSTSGQSLGLEHAAAAIETWVRRLGSVAPVAPKLVAGRRPVSSEMGDLIELLDGTGSDDGKTFDPSPGTFHTTPTMSHGHGSTGHEDSGNNSLRGRLGGLKTGGKGGKTD